MRVIWGFVKRTLLGGLLVLLPVYLAILLLLKAVHGMAALLKPLVSHLAVDAKYHNMVAIALIVVLSFLIGLVMTSHAGKRAGHWFTTHVLDRIPGYSLIRSIVRRTFGDDTAEFKTAFVEIEEALVVGYVVEEHTDGRYTVFVPSSPTPFSGAVYVLTPERVHIVDVPFVQAFQAMAKWGTGTRGLLQAMEKQQAAKAG